MATTAVKDNVGNGSIFEQLARVRPLELPILIFVTGSGGSTLEQVIRNAERERQQITELLEYFFQGIPGVVVQRNVK